MQEVEEALHKVEDQQLLEEAEGEAMEAMLTIIPQLLEQLILEVAEAHQVGEISTMEDQGLAVQEL
jgi:hypothetical protein